MGWAVVAAGNAGEQVPGVLRYDPEQGLALSLIGDVRGTDHACAVLGHECRARRQPNVGRRSRHRREAGVHAPRMHLVGMGGTAVEARQSTKSMHASSSGNQTGTLHMSGDSALHESASTAAIPGGSQMDRPLKQSS